MSEAAIDLSEPLEGVIYERIAQVDEEAGRFAAALHRCQRARGHALPDSGPEVSIGLDRDRQLRRTLPQATEKRDRVAGLS